MCRRFPALFLLFGAACATSLAPLQPSPVPVNATPPARAESERLGDASGPSAPLQATLLAFAQRAHRHRAGVRHGAPMPPSEVDNLLGLLGALDEFLSLAARHTAALDVARARVTLEAELELDARTYGDIPRELAETALDRVARLSMRMSELRRLKLKAPREKVEFHWPVDPVAVTSLFGTRFHPILKVKRRHLGIDLAAEEGQLVTSAAPGAVIRAAWSGGHGFRVEVQHPGDVVTSYSHLSQIWVDVGERLKRGDPVGLAGNTGQATGVHLHFEVWRAGRPRDPLEELRPPTPRLTPLALASPLREADFGVP